MIHGVTGLIAFYVNITSMFKHLWVNCLQSSNTQKCKDLFSHVRDTVVIKSFFKGNVPLMIFYFYEL